MHSLIQKSTLADKKDTALAGLNKMIEMDSITKYDDKTECQLLGMVVNAINRNKDDINHIDYLVDALSESHDGVCAHGRASRMIDCLALMND